MPRANRHFLPGHVWHITQRCHDRAFLLKAAADRSAWRQHLYEARSRFGLCVLNYIVTSNHIHLLVFDIRGDDTISRSMQYIAGRLAQAFNRRCARNGAFWSDRYHAVAVDRDEYLLQCLTYIDLNMVRAGVVKHPLEWSHCGYAEIQSPRSRYRIIDLDRLLSLTDAGSLPHLQATLRERAESALAGGVTRDEVWTTALAVGGERYVESVKSKLGVASRYRNTVLDSGRFILREPRATYSEEMVGISRL